MIVVVVVDMIVVVVAAAVEEAEHTLLRLAVRDHHGMAHIVGPVAAAVDAVVEEGMMEPPQVAVVDMIAADRWMRC